MLRINKNLTLGEIVAHIPKTTQIFNAYNIDYCCSGDRTLEVAIAEADLDLDRMLVNLRAFQDATKDLGSQKDFLNMETPLLIEYIVNAHHSYLYKNLPHISDLANAVLRAHGGKNPELFEIHKLFHSLKTELEQHLIKEEVTLYPSILNDDSNSKNVINEVEDEHDVAGDILKKLRITSQDYTVPKDGCATYEKLYAKLEEMEKDIFNHIHLENNILHKRL